MSRSHSDNRWGPVDGAKVCVTWSGETECPVCKKSFLVYTPDWYWKHRGENVCSYHCMRVLERQEEEETKKRGDRSGAWTIIRAGRDRVTEPVDVPQKPMAPEEREALIIKMRKHHYSYDAIGKAVGYSPRNVKHVLLKNGVYDANRVTEEEIAGYVRLRKAGMSIENIARRYKRSYSTVRANLIREGLGNAECGVQNSELEDESNAKGYHDESCD